MTNIVFYPVFETQKDINDFLSRATWYLYPLKDKLTRITFFYDGEITGIIEEPLLDKGIPRKYKNFEIMNISKPSETNIVSFLEKADYVFVHKERTRNDLIKFKKKEHSFEIVRVDHTCVQFADSFFLRFAERINNLHEEYESISKDKISKYLSNIKSDKVYLFGTGPNFSYTESKDFSDGLTIICNSMVINQKAIDKLNPGIIVIADPIFHAGPSSYAEEFRHSFTKIVKERNCPIIVPLRDYHIYKCYLEKNIIERVIPIAFKNSNDKEETPNLDITEQPFVTTTSNILTLFQIPLATTFGNKIYISGCDGRPLSHNNYFWKHDKSVQINEKMEEIKKAHPAFFNISYDDYYIKHIETLEKWISTAEQKGIDIVNLTPSYIPSLQTRTTDSLLKDLKKNKRQHSVSMVIPIYNSEQYIEKCVNSIIEERIDNLEIIIVDDFSEDNSLDVCRKLQAQNDGIRVFQNIYKKGVSGARNTGLALCTGEIIGFLDSDDIVFKGSIKNRMRALVKNPKINIVHSTLSFIDENDNELGVEVGARKEITFEDAIGNPASFNTLMFKKHIIKHLSFNLNLTNGEDWLAIAKILRLGYTSNYVKDGRAAYRVHSNSTVIKNNNAHEENLVPVIDWLFSTTKLYESCNQHKEGLKKELKDDIYLGRKFNQLIMSVLKGDQEKINILTTDNIFLNWLSSLNNDISSRIKVPLVRHYVKHIEELRYLPLKEKSRLSNSLNQLTKITKNRIFFDGFDKVLGLRNEHKLPHGDSLHIANRNFINGKYEDARRIYEKLLYKDDFYRFLSFNIDLCNKKQGSRLAEYP